MDVHLLFSRKSSIINRIRMPRICISRICLSRTGRSQMVNVIHPYSWKIKSYACNTPEIDSTPEIDYATIIHMSKIDHNIYTILATTQYESLPFSSYTSLAKYDDYNTLKEIV